MKFVSRSDAVKESALPCISSLTPLKHKMLIHLAFIESAGGSFLLLIQLQSIWWADHFQRCQFCRCSSLPHSASRSPRAAPVSRLRVRQNMASHSSDAPLLRAAAVRVHLARRSQLHPRVLPSLSAPVSQTNSTRAPFWWHFYAQISKSGRADENFPAFSPLPPPWFSINNLERGTMQVYVAVIFAFGVSGKFRNSSEDSFLFCGISFTVI